MNEQNQIITLCGSARFERYFKAWNEALTLAGHTVFSLSVYPSDKAGEKNWYSADEKRVLDAAHLRKIAASNAIFVLNRFAYIGESTLNEINYARQLGKRMYALESWGKGNGIGESHKGSIRDEMEKLGLTRSSASPIDTFRSHASGFTCPWSGELLGPAGSTRSKIVQIVRGVEGNL